MAAEEGSVDRVDLVPEGDIGNVHAAEDHVFPVAAGGKQDTLDVVQGVLRLLRKIRGGAPATREELQAFTQELYREYQAFYGQVGTAAQRMKEVWFYLIHLFEGGERIDKKMRRSRSPGEYESLEAQIFAELPLRDHAEGPLI